MKYTRKDIQAVYDEVERRIQMDIKNGYLADDNGYIPAEAIESYRGILLQGVYSVLMTLSDDWPNVRQTCLEEEESRKWYVI